MIVVWSALFVSLTDKLVVRSNNPFSNGADHHDIAGILLKVRYTYRTEKKKNRLTVNILFLHGNKDGKQ